ncbi:MAG: sugar phosphate isomerase/epimerase [Ruminococcaceae bacterium]|nr:sugar phosphate isomerase/epimerase [Oscillospiraceae bacterium]
MKIGVCRDIKDLKMFDSSVVDYCEMSLTSISEMSDEAIDERVAIIRDTGIPVSCVNGFFPKEIPLCGPDMNEEQIKKYTENALYKANKLGVKTLVLGSGKARYIKDGWDKELCLEQFERVCIIAGEIAAKYNMMVVIEPLESAETNSINTVKEGADIVRHIDHPNVGLLCDVYHFESENEPIENILDNKDILKHFHIANPNGRVFPKKDDAYDYTKVAKALKEIGYEGKISIEGKAQDFKNDLGESVTFLKEVFA